MDSIPDDQRNLMHVQYVPLTLDERTDHSSKSPKATFTRSPATKSLVIGKSFQKVRHRRIQRSLHSLFSATCAFRFDDRPQGESSELLQCSARRYEQISIAQLVHEGEEAGDESRAFPH